MEVKIKKLKEEAIIPQYAKNGDAGLDFTATSVNYDSEIDCIVYGTGLAVEIPEGHVGLLFPRSSISNYDLYLTNCVGVIDSGYRGEIMFKFKALPSYIDVPEEQTTPIDNGIFEVYTEPIDCVREGVTELIVYKLGDRVGQMIILPYPKVEFILSEELSDSERGIGGYGSTNR